MSASFEKLTVADAMHEGVVSCDRGEPLTEVARLMAEHRIHCVVVWREPAGPDDSELWGVVSDLDLAAAAAAGDVAARTAGDTAATPALTIAPDEPLPGAAQLMAEHEITHLVVVDPKTAEPVGVLSTLDLARAVAGAPWPAAAA